MADDYYDYTEVETDLFEAADAWADQDITALLDDSREAERERLEQALARIDHQLAERDALHEAVVEDLEWTLERYTARLETLYRQNRGNHDGTRERVQDRITEFSQELREVHRAHWRDRQALEQERREVRRELAELDEDLWSVLG